MSEFKSSVSITYIGTATSLIEIDGATFLTDPAFDSAETEYDVGVTVLKNTAGPAIPTEKLPPFDAVLLSHEDHPDNLDNKGRQLLEGRKVVTTMDGAKNLSPRPGVQSIQPWQTIPLQVNGKEFKITGTPTQHLPGGECTGFILENEKFGKTGSKANVIYISGDTVYIDQLKEIGEKYHVVLAVLNLGKAMAPTPDGGKLQITMGARDGSKLFKDIGADLLVPLHYECWDHFTEFDEEARKIFQEEGISDSVMFLSPGVQTKIL